MERRQFLKCAPAAVAATMTPISASAFESNRAAMLDVIEGLEAWQGWEPSSVVSAKAFAAWQMRKAMGLDLPDPKTAQMHVDYQRAKFREYQGTVHFDPNCEIAPAERKLV